jgi:hypothetical protein
MDRRARLLTLILSATLLVSLTMACIPGLPGGGPSAEDTPVSPPPSGETPISGPSCGDGVCDAAENADTCPQDCQAPEGETPAPPPPEEQLPFDLNVDALEGLSSYGYALHMDGLSTMGGATENVVLDIEGQRQSAPTKAEELKFSSTSDGEVTSMQVVYIEDLNKMWMREGDEAWQELPVMDASMLQVFDAFSMLTWWDTLFAGDPGDAQYVGPEVVNGVPCNHYRASEAAGLGAFTAGCTFASYSDEVWVAVDGSFPVKRQLSSQADCQGQSGGFNFSMELRNVNQPLDIKPPM